MTLHAQNLKVLENIFIYFTEAVKQTNNITDTINSKKKERNKKE